VAVLGGGAYSYFRYETHLASLEALTAYDEIAADFGRLFGRHHDVLERYRCDDAELVFFMMGAFATKAKDAVDRLRAAGYKIGLVRLRLLRPYPVSAIRAALAGKRAVAVIDQNLSMGKGGVLYTELLSALYGHREAPPIVASFIGGLGGRDITAEEFYEMAQQLQRAADSGVTPDARLLFTDTELRQFRKLQSIAVVERNELGDGP
jgi:pyruvate ferredoxin oxidoreductase alpha subunit